MLDNSYKKVFIFRSTDVCFDFMYNVHQVTVLSNTVSVLMFIRQVLFSVPPFFANSNDWWYVFHITLVKREFLRLELWLAPLLAYKASFFLSYVSTATSFIVSWAEGRLPQSACLFEFGDTTDFFLRQRFSCLRM